MLNALSVYSGALKPSYSSSCSEPTSVSSNSVEPDISGDSATGDSTVAEAAVDATDAGGSRTKRRGGGAEDDDDDGRDCIGGEVDKVFDDMDVDFVVMTGPAVRLGGGVEGLGLAAFETEAAAR